MLKENAVHGQAISPVHVDTRERCHISYDEKKLNRARISNWQSFTKHVFNPTLTIIQDIEVLVILKPRIVTPLKSPSLMLPLQCKT